MTQPNDPRKVKVIVELIDHSTRIAATYERGDLVERLGRAKERISDPQIRVVIAGQLKQGKSQLLNSLLNVPVARVGDDETTALATVVSYGEQASARLIVARGDGAEPEFIEIPPSEVQTDLRRAPQAGGREVLRVEVTAPSPLLEERSGVRRHPWRRRPRAAPPLGDTRPAARRARNADDQRRQPGVHRAGDDLRPPGSRNLPAGNNSRDQDRSLSALARGRGRQRRTPAAGGHRHADRAGFIGPAQPCDPDERQGAQRGVELPRHRQVPQREGSVGGERPGSRPGARRSAFGGRAFDACP